MAGIPTMETHSVSHYLSLHFLTSLRLKVSWQNFNAYAFWTDQRPERPLIKKIQAVSIDLSVSHFINSATIVNKATANLFWCTKTQRKFFHGIFTLNLPRTKPKFTQKWNSYLHHWDQQNDLCMRFGDLSNSNLPFSLLCFHQELKNLEESLIFKCVRVCFQGQRDHTQ